MLLFLIVGLNSVIKSKIKIMGKPFQGSLNLTLLWEAAKTGHSAFVRAGKKKHVFVNVTLWENDSIDQFGNIMSLQVNPAKDTTSEKFYIGNFKPTDSNSEPIKAGDVKGDDDDLPF